MKKRFSSLVSSFHGSCMSKEEISSSALPPTLWADAGVGYHARAAPALVASRCGCVRREGRARRRSAAAVDVGEDDMSRARETPAYLWRKEERWQAVAFSEEAEMAKVDEDDQEEEEDEDDVPFAIEFTKSRTREMVIQQRSRERRISTSSRDSSCSSSSDDEENDEREDGDEHDEDDDNDFGDVDDPNALLSSLSSPVAVPARSRSVSPSAAGMPRRLVPAAFAEEGRVQESFAVVKKSEDPRGDFRRSMAEMVAEKGMYDASDLEQLLHCFLSLNSRHHHRAIVSAFSDVWHSLFPDDSPNFIYK